MCLLTRLCRKSLYCGMWYNRCSRFNCWCCMRNLELRLGCWQCKHCKHCKAVSLFFGRLVCSTLGIGTEVGYALGASIGTLIGVIGLGISVGTEASCSDWVLCWNISANFWRATCSVCPKVREVGLGNCFCLSTLMRSRAAWRTYLSMTGLGILHFAGMKSTVSVILKLRVARMQTL